MCMWRSLSLGLILLSGASIATAQSQRTDIRPHAERMTGENLNAVFEGQTHDGAYNFNLHGVASTQYLETHSPDGKIIYSEYDLEFTGSWIIQNHNICYHYDDPGLNSGCFRVYRIQNCYYFYSAQLPEHADEIDRDYWWARSVIKGEEPLCVPAIS